MCTTLNQSLQHIHNFEDISTERRAVLQPLIDYLQPRVVAGKDVNLNFICTHNSRRSHLAQVWAQLAAAYYQIPSVYTYSGGTEQTALFPKVVQTLADQGFTVLPLSQGDNPVYTIKYSDNTMPIIGFSKAYDHPFNPVADFAAVMTCSQADTGCPYIAGADIRIPITYEDPKIADHTAEQDRVYAQRSLQIATEMAYVFSQIRM